jgi:UDPglucose--hexose-1-phosphate uridylyltransferase
MTTVDPLPRHDLVHPDGRAFHVYGELHGTLNGQPSDVDVGDVHLRYDMLSDAWVAVSPARNTRPGGEVIRTTDATACPLCPGGTELPFAYDAAVFDNRFPALSSAPPAVLDDWRVAPARGRCEMVVYTSNHEGSLSTLAPDQVARVVAIWRDRSSSLWAQGHDYVMVFENHGAEVGATLSHPHGQIYALSFVPPATAAKVAAIDRHQRERARCLGCDLVVADADEPRIVVANDSFTAAVPFAARWPFEVHLRSRRHGCGRLGDLTDGEALDLARAIRGVTARFDGLFGRELPYMLCVQEAPAGSPDWHLHVELLPPHRDEHRLKIRASVETALGVFLNDTRPEDSARRLAAVPVDDGQWDGVVVPQIEPVSEVDRVVQG